MGRKEEMDEIIKQKLDTPEGRKAICDMIIDPIRKAFIVDDFVNATIMGEVNNVAYDETYFF